MNDQTLKKTALYEIHKQAGARIVPFAGWLMPVQYSSIIEEHLAVRNAVGLFDVSHMGEIDFRGPDALKAVQRLICNDAQPMTPGQVIYSGLMTDEGAFVDDVLVYKFTDEHFMFCVNASNTDKDYAWIMNHLVGSVKCENISDTICQIAIQGPKALALLSPMVDVPLADMRYYRFEEGRVLGHEAIISRTGYTGERGYEIYVKNEYGPEIWNKLMEDGKEYNVKPIGLGARDTLRLEASMPLYGNDIDDKTTPYEAGLEWIVKLDKGDFIGSNVLKAQKERGIQRKLVGFKMIGKGIARHGYSVYHDGELISSVTSGGYAPFLDASIGMTYLPVNLAVPGNRIHIQIRTNMTEAEVVAFPFYSKRTKSKDK